VDISLLNEDLSLGVSAVLILLYIANLIYTLVTHRDVFAGTMPTQPEGKSSPAGDQGAKPIWRSIAVLLIATIFTALEAELVSSSLAATSASWGISTFFLGVIVLSIAGNTAEYISAIYFAHKQEMALVMPITVGSSIQVGLLVAPLLVIISYLIGRPMNLVFSNPLELIAIAGVAFAVNAIAKDGKVTWFEGVLLIGVYIILAIAFFFVT
jgi:Ca2+:H+ antiporter